MGRTCGGPNEIELTAAVFTLPLSFRYVAINTLRARGLSALEGTRLEPFNLSLMGVNSISPAHLHVRTPHVGVPQYVQMG